MVRIRHYIVPVVLLMLVAATPVTGDDEGCKRLDMKVTCTIEPARTVLVGDPFTAVATVENTGDVALINVVLAIRGREGVTQVKSTPLEIRIPKLEPNETKSLRATFVSDAPGERFVNASARDDKGWAAAGCFCGVLIKGLPALQVEMIDLDQQRKSKGIFQVGEEFLYILKVENDVGTALTPDLRVVWTLPPELEFVRGVGDGGATVTGSGQAAQSSTFVLAPNKVQNFELTCRVVSVPARNLVQTRASVVSDAGNQELATETESTTLKN